MHLKAFEGRSPPVPIEIMVFLVLGWLFVLVGDYKAMRLAKTRTENLAQKGSFQRADEGMVQPV
jgi:hypothetical protein